MTHMKLSQASATPLKRLAERCGSDSSRIRFLQHPFDYYAEGNTLVRMTSGVAKGLMGYRIRISRDRCLVTDVNGQAMAIGGIHKDSYEEVKNTPHLREINETKALSTPRQLAAKKHSEDVAQKYAEAVRLYAETDMTITDISLKCGISRMAFSQHLRRHERNLMLRRHDITTEGKDPQAIKIIQAGHQNIKAHEKYKDAVAACDSADYIGMNVSQVAHLFNVTPTGLANFMRRHYPDIIPNRERQRQQLGLADNVHRGMSNVAKEQYREAVELYRSTDMTLPEIALKCNVPEHGLLQHLSFYHKNILQEKADQRKQAKATKRKPKGAMLGNGRRNRPSSAVVMKYAAALALYKSTAMTMKDIVEQTGVPAQGFRFYVHKWHKPLVLERSGIEANEFDTVNIAKQRTRMKTVAAKYAPAIASLKADPRPVAAVAREYGHNPEVFRQYLHKHEPELAAKFGRSIIGNRTNQ